ncbi:hypothetical protein NQ016_03950 [Staphylococcus hyicus]|uniref:hypothetical protein n=1 Tax=Staphylococcus hyicus TaxID=1284 RepID=UPI00211BDA22|nr:hypothetical protein [Staphylococcus hyicus]MCQ9290671.1 hypothetical protein [Staphylococcus hyicus]MCQ9305913.1 hypothetical protein [Staphylococcus hyicus]MCQ9308325.1 hypothetical protein [Staphylococcus hyicus]MCQ9310747.1 hypothetical protein [Staphylococcus hyicus]
MKTKIKPYDLLTEKEKAIATSNKITPNIYNKRINDDWRKDYALTLNRLFKKDGDKYFKIVTAYDKEFELTAEHKMRMIENGIEEKILQQRLKAGTPLNDAIEIRLNELPEDYEERKFLEKWERKQKLIEERAKKAEQLKQKRKKFKSIPKEKHYHYLEYMLLRQFKEA